MNNYKSDYISNINKKVYKELTNNKYISNKKLKVYEVENGIVVPPYNPKKNKKKNPSNALFGSGGVIDKSNNYVVESGQYGIDMHDRIGFINTYDKTQLKTMHKKVIYMNFFIKQWGHYLIDVIGRLWYALQDKETMIAYTTYNDEDYYIDGNYLELIELLGIDLKRIIRINKPTIFDKVIVPETSIVPGRYYTKEYSELFDTIVENCKIPSINKKKKIYCSRMKFGKSNEKEFGEEILEKNMNSNNYKSVYLERIPLKEQIKTLNESNYVAMTCGSLSHNLLFVKNKNTIFIFNKTYRINSHQFLVNEIAASKVFFIDVYVSPLPILYGYGPFIIRITKEFENYAKDYNIEIVNNEKKVSFLLKFKYYYRYLISYRKFLVKFKKISESDNKKYEIDLKTIRKQYKEYLTKR